ncbi:MAG: presenilin family intramembrane aspartyl protease [Nanobdellota archaeon]
MKHSFRITAILILTFILAQVAGLLITNQFIEYTPETGEVEYKELPYDIERPEVGESKAYIFIIIGVLLGTGLLLLLIKFKKTNMWKLWYGLAVVITLGIALSAFMHEIAALVLSLAAAYFKILKPNVIVHNLTEIFMYGGIAAIFVPVLNVFSAFMLLLLISIYDMIAVWKSKHMVKMAKFQSKSKLFAGLSIPYSGKAKPVSFSQMGSSEAKSGKVKGAKKEKVKSAILGGGDIAFPLIFSGVIMKDFIHSGISRSGSIMLSLIITITSAAALSYLFYKSQKGRFYPAMPFISIGCLVGYGILMLIV